MTLDELEALTRDFEVKHPRSKLATRVSMSQATWDRITDVVPVTRGDRADIAGPPPTGIPVEITPTLPTDVVRVRYADGHTEDITLGGSVPAGCRRGARGCVWPECGCG